MSTTAALGQWIEQRTQRWQAGRTDAVLRAAPLRALGEAMHELLDALERCDFSTMLRPLGWWRRLTGERVLHEVRFRVADREIAQLMARAQACADAQAAWHQRWQELSREHGAYVQGLVDRIRVEQRLLALDTPEERDARSRHLQNAQLVLSSAQLTQHQFDLLQGRHDTVLARFHEIKHTLIPMWLDQLTAVIQGRALQADHLQAATDTYTALQRQLRRDLESAATEERR